jgi:DNA mismatch repair ATPase MutS
MTSNDKVTLKDLSIFSAEGNNDVFSLINKTSTKAGQNYLAKHIEQPPQTFAELIEVQEAVKFWATHLHLWPTRASNGTIVMLEKYFESAEELDVAPDGFSLLLGSYFQKWFNKNQYSFIRFSLSHLADFLRACRSLALLVNTEAQLPHYLKQDLQAIQDELQQDTLIAQLLEMKADTPYKQLVKLSFNAHRLLKDKCRRLIDRYSKQDALCAMAKAGVQYNWQFPRILPGAELCFCASGLYHPLLQHPVPYEITLGENKNFMLLTGANMSGKTTFMRAVGVAALLAHLGMGVPATSLSISFLNGIISNMQVEDNILLGESYFFAEVQRMKLIGQKMHQEAPCLVLMDELFKGTNVHDAYDCTQAVVQQLLNRKDHLMLMSTHLHELALHFAQNKQISFAYFQTVFNQDHSFTFTYRLKEGISNDKLGYKILQKEGILEILKS